MTQSPRKTDALLLVAVLHIGIGWSSAVAAGPESAKILPNKKGTAVVDKHVAEGKRLFKALDCERCHSIENSGGCLAPPLDRVTQRDSEQYLMLRLGKGEEANFIKRIGHPELMPHPRFERAQLKEIIAYLKTLPKQSAPAPNTPHPHASK